MSAPRARHPDGSMERDRGPLLGSPNRFKLAVFCPNVQRGTTNSFVDGTLDVTWDETLRVSLAAERAGIEAVVPLGRWRNASGAGTESHRMFETLTWAAGVAAATSRVQVFATVHVPLVNPVFAAKAATTIDHISHGRFALNVVAGFSAMDFDMFGVEQLPHDDRYEAAAEWIEVLERAWTEDEPFDVDGRFYAGRAVTSEPKPIQRPRPPIMSAGSSPAGLRFARRHADINFVALPDLDGAPEVIRAAKHAAHEEAGRDLQVFAGLYLVCRDTDAEAADYHHHVFHERVDRAAAEGMLDSILPQSRSADVIARAALLERATASMSMPIVGSPERIAETLRRLSLAGLDGAAVSWPDYDDGIARFERDLRPAMTALGLRIEPGPGAR